MSHANQILIKFKCIPNQIINDFCEFFIIHDFSLASVHNCIDRLMHVSL